MLSYWLFWRIQHVFPFIFSDRQYLSVLRYRGQLRLQHAKHSQLIHLLRHRWSRRLSHGVLPALPTHPAFFRAVHAAFQVIYAQKTNNFDNSHGNTVPMGTVLLHAHQNSAILYRWFICSVHMRVLGLHSSRPLSIRSNRIPRFDRCNNDSPVHSTEKNISRLW